MEGADEQVAFKTLVASARSDDPDAVEDALIQAFQAGITAEYVPVLIELLGMAWHFKHEDIVSALQGLKDPRAVDPLIVPLLLTTPTLNTTSSSDWRGNVRGHSRILGLLSRNHV